MTIVDGTAIDALITGKAFDRFLAKYQVKYHKTTDCLVNSRDAPSAFCDAPAEH